MPRLRYSLASLFVIQGAVLVALGYHAQQYRAQQRVLRLISESSVVFGERTWAQPYRPIEVISAPLDHLSPEQFRELIAAAAHLSRLAGFHAYTDETRTLASDPHQGWTILVEAQSEQAVLPERFRDCGLERIRNRFPDCRITVNYAGWKP